MNVRGVGPGDRRETGDERADRLWGELLHEVRVTLTGVQILLAFLLAAAFTPVFERLSTPDQYMYVACVLLGAAATGALTAPVCVHRLVTGLGLKPETVVWAARFTAVGLVLLLGMVALALLIVLRMVLSAPVALALDGVLVIWFSACWLLPGLLLRRRAVQRLARVAAAAQPEQPSAPSPSTRRYPTDRRAPARVGGPRIPVLRTARAVEDFLTADDGPVLLLLRGAGPDPAPAGAGALVELVPPGRVAEVRADGEAARRTREFLHGLPETDGSCLVLLRGTRVLDVLRAGDLRTRGEAWARAARLEHGGTAA
ncbi:DUF6328 family protein [Streptomyces sp. NPDC003042]